MSRKLPKPIDEAIADITGGKPRILPVARLPNPLARDFNYPRRHGPNRTIMDRGPIPVKRVDHDKS